jgi:hypothetical protein
VDERLQQLAVIEERSELTDVAELVECQVS